MKWFLMFLSAFAFVYGILVGKYEIFPHDQLAGFKQQFAGVLEDTLVEEQFSPELPTVHADFKRSVFNFLNTSRLSGWGGALARYQNGLVGADREGHFYFYQKGGDVTLLPNLTLKNNEGAVIALLSQESLETLTYNRILNNFRILDVLTKPGESNTELFVSYHFFDPDKQEKLVKVAKITLAHDTPLTEQTFIPENVFTVKHGVPYDVSYDSAFRSNRHGGRMALKDDHTLLLALGDNQYDGFSHDQRASQDPQSDYGKLIQINLTDLSTRYVVNGLRNPQGLVITSSGAILESEHGPQGGDELNLLQAGKNYGWPFVTYGLNYGDNQWPLQNEQGRHEGYEKPLMTWIPSIATSNIIEAAAPAEWQGDILLGTLKEQSIYRLRFDSGRIIFSEKIFVGERVRDLEQLADGTIVLWTDNARFMELQPKEREYQAEQSKPEFTAEERNAKLPELLQQCKECHVGNSLQSAQLPKLELLYNQPIAAARFAGYSAGLQAKQSEKWHEVNLDAFLAQPEVFAPGTSMAAFAVTNATQRQVLIQYLKKQ